MNSCRDPFSEQVQGNTLNLSLWVVRKIDFGPSSLVAGKRNEMPFHEITQEIPAFVPDPS